MKRIFQGMLLASTLALAPLAFAVQPNETANPYYSQEEFQNTHSMFDKIQADLNQAETNAYPDLLGDRSRFDIARKQFTGLERQWDQGEFDTREFDNTFTALQMVLYDNRLLGHDREVLSADLSRLLEFRTEYY
jgi:hypothetical protein